MIDKSIPVVVLLAFIATGQARAEEIRGPRVGSYDDAVRPLLKQYCFVCHGVEHQEADLRLDILSPDLSDLQTAETWNAVLEALNAGDMPPEDKPQPQPNLLRVTLASLAKASVQATDFHSSRRRTVRRMNRREYLNTVNDLLGVQLEPWRLPEDSVPLHGFDTYGAALPVSPNLIEEYLIAGRFIATELMRVGAVKPGTLYQRGSRYGRGSIRGLHMVDKKDPGTRIHSRLDAAPWPGEYCMRVTCWVQNPKDDHSYLNFRKADGLFTVTGTKQRPDVIEISMGTRFAAAPYYVVHRKPADVFVLSKNRKPAGIATNPGITHIETIELVGTAGHQAGYRLWGPLVEYLKVEQEEIPPRRSGEPVRSGEIALKGNPPDKLADAFFRRFLERIFRGDKVDTALLERMQTLFKESRRHGVSYGEAMIDPIAMALASPQFIYISDFRSEEHAAVSTETRGVELAHRISYLMWSSAPDEELMTAAKDQKLASPHALSEQFDRMESDPKFHRFVEAFTTQWLELDRLDLIAVNSDLYPEFYEGFRDHYRNETIEFIAEGIKKDLPIKNLIDSDFTMTNHFMAKNYGLDPIANNEFQKVSLPSDSPYGGLLTQASIAAITSDGLHTSPVERGVWVLRKMLDDSPPPPPANVAPLESSEGDGVILSKRELVARHRAAPECASCHNKIDPIGFGLESLDILGRFRTQENRLREATDASTELGDDDKSARVKSLPVDTKGSLEGYGSFDNAKQLKGILAEHDDVVARSFVKALFSYALGRPIGFSDTQMVDRVVQDAKQNDLGMRSLIRGVFTSDEICRP